MGVLDGAAALVDTVASVSNYQQQKKKFEYEKKVQGTTWEREDNAVQRRVADLRAAGLSPTLAAGSAAQTSGPIKTTTPQISENIGTNAYNKTLMAADLMTKRQNIETSKAQEMLLKAQADKAHSEANVLQQTEGQRIETAIANNRQVQETLQSNIDRAKNQTASSFSQAQIDNYKASMNKQQLDWYQDLNQYLQNAYSAMPGGVYMNPMIIEAIAAKTTLELKQHDVELYKKLPVPSGVLGSAISGLSGIAKQYIPR